MDFDSVYFQMIIDCNYQTAASIDITRLYQIGSFRINLNYHIRCLNLESLSTGDVGCEQDGPTITGPKMSNIFPIFFFPFFFTITIPFPIFFKCRIVTYFGIFYLLLYVPISSFTMVKDCFFLSDMLTFYNAGPDI